MSDNGDKTDQAIPTAGGPAPVSATPEADHAEPPAAVAPVAAAPAAQPAPAAKRMVGEKIREDAVAHSTELREDAVARSHDLREAAVAYAREVGERLRK